MLDWIDMFYATHTVSSQSGVRRIDWPDGGCYLEQETLLVDVFNEIRAKLIMLMNAAAKAASNKARLKSGQRS